MLKAWRIVKAKHSADAFTGQGAKRAGGRWNSPGIAVIYAAGSISLAMLEMLAHLELQDVLNSYVLFELSFDETLATTVAAKSLPKTWRKSPPPPAVQAIGDAWIASSVSVALCVPSVIVPSESNYLFNPNHPDFAKVVIGPKQPVKFDSRLIKT